MNTYSEIKKEKVVRHKDWRKSQINVFSVGIRFFPTFQQMLRQGGLVET